jgi:hypothetical protein
MFNLFPHFPTAKFAKIHLLLTSIFIIFDFRFLNSNQLRQYFFIISETHLICLILFLLMLLESLQDLIFENFNILSKFQKHIF